MPYRNEKEPRFGYFKCDGDHDMFQQKGDRLYLS